MVVVGRRLRAFSRSINSTRNSSGWPFISCAHLSSLVTRKSQNQVFIIIIPLNGTRSRWNLFYGEGSVSELLMTSHLFPGSIVLNGHHLINHHQQQRWPPQTTTRTKNHHRVRQFHQNLTIGW